MKRVLAILCLLALVCSQPLALFGNDCNASKPCCGCGGKMKCCLAKSDGQSANVPAVPASDSAQKDFQFLNLPPASVPVVLIQADDSRIAPHIFAAPSANAIPIFTWDCAYLI